MNYFAGEVSDQYERKRNLVAGWFIALPVPFMLVAARSWTWVQVANGFLGASQGLTWSTTVIMKIDLVGTARRGLAMGLNEFAGYFAVAASALATAYIAQRFGLRPAPFYLGVGYVFMGLALSVGLVRDTHNHAKYEGLVSTAIDQPKTKPRDVFIKTSFTDHSLSSITQAGFVNNLNDGMAWGLFPLLFAASGLALDKIGWLAAIYPATWGILQLWTGHLSDILGRKGLITWGMFVQAAGITTTALSSSFAGFVLGGVLLGVGTAMVYPTLLAAIGDVAHPTWRASAVGVYRLWRDSGYAVGAVIAGIVSDAFGITAAVLCIAAITATSGLVVAIRMRETIPSYLR